MRLCLARMPRTILTAVALGLLLGLPGSANAQYLFTTIDAPVDPNRSQRK